MNSLLVNYRQRKLPGDFKVEQANVMIYVTPIKVLRADGVVRDVFSPLTTPVTIPFERRNMADTVQVILDAVNKDTGLQITRELLTFGPPTW